MSECKCGHDIREHVIDKAGTNICYCLHNNMDCGCQKYVVKESKKRPDLERPEIEKALQFASTGNKVPLDVTAEIARYALQVEKERDQEKANGDRLAETLEDVLNDDYGADHAEAVLTAHNKLRGGK